MLHPSIRPITYFLLVTFVAPRCFALEWEIQVDGALLLDELVHDQYNARGLLVRDQLENGAKFLAVRGTVIANDWSETDSSLKIPAKDVAVIANKTEYGIAGNKWSPTHYSTGLSYFSLYKPKADSKEKAARPFLFVFIVPANTTPTQLRILDKTQPIEPEVGRRLTRPAQTATWSVKASGFVDQFSVSESYRVAKPSQRVNAARSIVAAHGKLFGVTLEVTPRTGGYKDPAHWHHTFSDFGILVDGRTWTAAVTQRDPQDKSFTSSGGGILVTRRDDKWPTGTGTLFFVVPADMKSYQITVGGDVIASGKVATIGGESKTSR